MSSYRSPSFIMALAALALVLAALACNSPTPATPPPSVQLTATSSELVTPAGSPPPANLAATTNVETNIRTGPSTDYAVLGTLAAGLPVRLTGRNADKSWLQIEFPAGPGGRAWVSAANVDIKAGANVDALPVVDVPPAPTRTPTAVPSNTPTPTPTVTPKPITATPKPRTATPVPVLRADKTLLVPGECTTLRWDVDNVKAVFLDVGQGEEPVVGHDTRRVCQDATKTYTLRVVKTDDTSQTYSVTIAVSGQCGNVPTISYFDASAAQIKPGQSVTIAWEVLCARAVFLKEGTGESQPVVGRYQRQFKPAATTVYTLIAIAQDGSEFRQQLTVTVAP